MGNAARSPEFQMIVENWGRFPTSVAGQWYRGSAGSEPPMQFPTPLVGPFTSQVSYLYPREVSVCVSWVTGSRPAKWFTKRIDASLSVHPNDRLVAVFTGRVEAER